MKLCGKNLEGVSLIMFNNLYALDIFCSIKASSVQARNLKENNLTQPETTFLKFKLISSSVRRNK